MAITAPWVRVIDADFTLYGEIDAYTSLTLTEGYSAAGSFEMVLPTGCADISIFAPGRFILTRDFCGLIERVLMQSGAMAGESDTITVSGCEAGGMLRYRVVIPPDGQSHWTHTGTPGQCMAQLASDQAISPTDTARAMDITLGTVASGEGTINAQSRYDILSDKLKEIAGDAGLGWGIYPDLDALKWVFKVYAGRDLSVNQETNSPLILSPQLDNMEAASYEWSIADTYNRAIVAGQGEGAARMIETVDAGEAQTGASLRETFIDARDLKTQSGLIDRGQSKLRECAITQSFEGTAALKLIEKYGISWTVGDIATIRHDEWGAQMDARISEVTRAYTAAGVTLSIALGEAAITLTGKLKRMTGGGIV